MSLFYSSREVRMIRPEKRKRAAIEGEEEGPEKYSCSWCTDEYDSETELHVHKRVKHKDTVQELLLKEAICRSCLTQHEDSDDLIKHIKETHLMSSEDAEHVHREIFICDLCHQIYFNKGMLIIHLQYIHNTENKQKLTGTCPKCNKKVQIRHVWFHFQQHMIQSVACCPICFKKCENQKELREHVSLHATYYHCDICTYDTKIKENFKAHMDSHDSTLQRSSNIAIDEAVLWRCFIPSKFPRKNSYNFGIRGFRLMELYICVLCRGICLANEKAAHIAKYHLIELVATKKQYICVCGEQFFNNVLLKHHVFKMKGNHKACDT